MWHAVDSDHVPKCGVVGADDVAKLEPHGVIVVIECEHLCMAMRGIRKPGAATITSAVRGGFAHSAKSRAEALSLIRG